MAMFAVVLWLTTPKAGGPVADNANLKQSFLARLASIDRLGERIHDRLTLHRVASVR